MSRVNELECVISDLSAECRELREQVKAQAAVIESLREALHDTLWFLERYSNRWDGINGKHPNCVVETAREALAIPTDSTQILEQYVKEKTQAQAAVIEQLTKRLASTNIIIEVVCAIHPDSACAKYELAENMNTIAIPTDSTQILAEVRRAERELVAQYVQQGTGDWMLGKKIAEAIRAME